MAVALVATSCSGGQKHVDDDLSSALQRETDFVRTELHIPGVTAAVVLPDGATWAGSSGYAIEREKQATPETLFAIGSVTKTFTAALVLRLVEEGVLRLDDPVGRWLPAYRGQPRLTIRTLLNHTSGIQELFQNPRFYPAVMRHPRARWDSGRTLGFVGAPNFAPGKGWSYSNTNYILLGAVIERATRQKAGDELRRLVLAPLGLDDVDLQDVAPPEGDLSHGYEDQDIGDRGTVGDVSDGTRYVPYTSMATVAYTAGGIVASAVSVARFAHDLFGGELLRPASLAEMKRFDARGDYGLGVMRVDTRGPTSFVGNHVVWGHNGATIGYRSIMWYAPSERIAVAVLMNSAASTEVLAERLLSVAVADAQRRSSGSSATHDALVRIDARTGERGTTIAVPATEKAVAPDGRVVWVYSQTAGTRKGKLTRIDARTGVPTGSFKASVPFATHVVVAGGSVWLGRPAWDWNPGGGLGHIGGDRPIVWRLRPGKRALEPAGFSGDGTGYENLAPVAAAGSLWVSCCLRSGALLRVDPATGRVLARIRSGEEVLAEGPGFVWASFRSWPPTGTPPPLCSRTCLRRIDTETNASAPIAAPRFVPADFAFANGAIWASAPQENAIVRLDPATGKELGRVDIGESPGALASANDALWVSLTGGSAVVRYDLETGDVETIDVGGTPSDLVVAGDSVWVAVER
jgi:D-alanyl-D-alanine carboxypeptidase